MKKIFLLFAAIFIFTLSACDDDSDSGSSDNGKIISNIVTEELTPFSREVVVMGVHSDIAEDETLLKEAFSDKDLFPNIKKEVSLKTSLLVVPNVNSEYHDAIEKVLSNGGVIAVTDPEPAALNAYLDTLQAKDPAGLDEIASEFDGDDILYSFGRFSASHVVHEAGDPDVTLNKNDLNDSQSLLLGLKGTLDNYTGYESSEDPSKDEIVTKENIDSISDYSTYLDDDGKVLPESEIRRAQNKDEEPCVTKVTGKNRIFCNLLTWVYSIKRDLDNAAQVANRKSHAPLHSSRADSDTKQIEDLFYYEHYSSDHTIHINKPIRRGHKVDANSSCGVSFQIYKIHSFDGNANSGDYYLIKMATTVDNGSMFKGSDKKWSYCTRFCAYWGKSLAVQVAPLKKDGDKWVKMAEGTEVLFPAGGMPLPKTDIGSTSVTDSDTFGINTDISLGGTKGMQNGNPVSTKDVNVSLGAAWSWTHSSTRVIKDVDIAYTGSTAVPSWKLVYNNTPHGKWSAKNGIDLGNALAYRATITLESSWVWYVPSASNDDAKDESDAPAIAIEYTLSPVFGGGGFWSTPACSWSDYDFYPDGGVFRGVIELGAMDRKKRGQIFFQNNSDKAVKCVEVYEESDTAHPLSRFTQTIIVAKGANPNYEGWLSAPYLTKGKKYIVKYIDEDDKTYVYKSKVNNDRVVLEGAKLYKVAAKDDFSPEGGN